MTAAQTELHQLIESVPHDGQKIVEHLDVGNPTERIVLAAERDDFRFDRHGHAWSNGASSIACG